jgi:hypothetical protein
LPEADSLSEAQIQRYARQVLLGPVGGRGQEALLQAPATVRGLAVTAAYLAAGGTPVDTELLDGFFDARPSGQLNPDAAPQTPSVGLVARIPFDFPASVERAVAVGRSAVVFRNRGCAQCFSQTVASLESGAPSVALEALAALAWQRLVLGLAEPLGALRLDEAPLTLVRCEVHR